MEALQRFHASNGRPLRLPVRLHKHREADLYRMWRQTMSYGGFEAVRTLLHAA
jgi:ARID/BRIGHT DNA binding domain